MIPLYKQKRLLLFCMAFLLGIVKSLANDSLSNSQRSISEVLNSDGTLMAGINGSFNAKGFAMGYGKNGSPVFSPQNTASVGNNGWDASASSYIGNYLLSVVVSNNVIYAGGSDIYRWDGSQWSTIGGGVGGRVNTIAISSTNDIYVGGQFTSAGGNAAIQYIAKWNGNTWNALGTDVNNSVNSIAILGNDVYAAWGSFGSNNNSIGKWNGSSWSILGSGLAYVAALATAGTDVYAGGDFSSINGTTVNYIAKWNGNVWSALGSGVGNGVRAITVSGTDVYVGGGFTSAGGSAANYIAKWNGSSWSALGAGVNSTVYAIAVSGSDVYVGGGLTSAGGSAANYIAKWNGSSWSTLGAGVNNLVYSIAIWGSDICIGGYFTAAGGSTANYIARWNSSSWSTLGTGLNNAVYAVAISGTDVYVGGGFTSIGSSTVNYIAKWNGSSWSALGSGLNYAVYALCISGGNLFAGGDFSAAGGSAASYIAKWDGSTWSAMGSGVSGTVHAIAAVGSNVYVGGEFFSAGGNSSIHYMAKWDGSTWSALGSGVNSSVYAIAVSGADVYVGGSFTNAGGGTANYIAKWNGSTWSALGSGMNTSVYAIAVSGTDVYACGSFTNAGGTTVNRVGKWNGSTWSALGSGVNNGAYAIAVSGTDVYVGGYFTTAGGNAINYVSKWDGSTWSSLGSGIGASSSVSALAISSGNLYAGGNFVAAGDKVADFFAVYHGSSSTRQWTGSLNTDWSIATNWTNNTIPSSGDDITVPSTGVSNEPTLGTDISINNLTIASGHTLTANAALTITGTANINNLNVQPGKTLTVNGAMTINGSLALKSDTTGTARIGTSTGTITGNITVERYLPAKRAFRFLSSPVSTSSSIRTNWQEAGGTAAGYGTHITGTGGSTNGFDATATNNASLFTFNTGTQAWTAVSNTNSNTLSLGTGYRLLVRGDRTVSLASNTPTATNTILRSTGTIATGSATNSSLSNTASGYSLIGNPYPSPVDWEAVTKINVNATYYVWDPTLSGSNGRGAYVAYNAVTHTNNNASSLVDRNIQLGQAFFVQTTGNGSASLGFTESMKTASNTAVFRNNGAQARIAVQLFVGSQITNPIAADGAIIVFDRSFSEGQGMEDAEKLSNLDENLSFRTNGKLYSIEGRSILNSNDTLQLELGQLTSRNYTLHLDASNLSQASSGAMQAYLLDAFLGKKLSVANDGSIDYAFEAADAVTDKNRFSIAFSKLQPVTTNGVIGLQLYPNPSNKQVTINYQGTNEGATTITITSSYGSIVKQLQLGNVSTVNKMIDVSDLSKGSYMVTFTVGKECITQKLIIQ